MNFSQNVKTFLNNAGADKLFLTFIPAFAAYFLTTDMFKSNSQNGFLLIIAVLCLQLGIQIFDDFMDWVSGQTKKRNELEQLGIRGNYNKCIYIYKDKKSPRRYLLVSVIMFFVFSAIMAFVCYTNQNYNLLYTIIILFLFALLIYTKSGQKVVSHIGNEFFITFLCVPLNMFVIFYGMSNYATQKLFAVMSVIFFFAFNVCYVSSLLNYKLDKMIQKQNLPVIVGNTNVKIYISLFLAIIPYILIPIYIFMEILPKLSYITFAMLPFSIWLFYLMYMFENSPQIPVKWHFLMGGNKYEIEDEQNNISWYTVRYNFARNIFVVFSVVLLCSLINYADLI